MFSAPRTVEVSLRILSSESSTVTCPDALIEVCAPVEAEVALWLNGIKVTSSLEPVAGAGGWRGLVSGFLPGPNSLSAVVEGTTVAELRVVAYPAGGPVFSGPHLRPWPVGTEAEGLGPALDADGNVAPRYELFYRDTQTEEFEPYDPAAPPRAGLVASTTTDAGVTVPYVVRKETGASNRGLYELAVLFDPNQPWSATRPQRSWNHKLHLHLHGGGAKLWRQASLSPPITLPPGAPAGVAELLARARSVLQAPLLGRGFMVLRASNIQAASNLESVRAAESLMMLKEYIVKHYGCIRYTIAAGASGGSMLQQLIANQYPGLLQGLVPLSSLCSDWDALSDIIDSHLLHHYFTEISPSLWQDPRARLAVSGHSSEDTIRLFATYPGFDTWGDPRTGTGLPEQAAFDPQTNPAGARATMQDYQVNYWGRRPPRVWTAAERAAGFGFAPLAWGNVGVQYGLGALLAGQITIEQFLNVNEKIGGVDLDYRIVPGRTEADSDCVATYYRGGFGNDARHLDTVAILDIRPPEHQEIIKTHTQFNTWKLRERLVRAHGHADNHVAWIRPGFNSALLAEEGILAMDRWLAAVEADTSDTPLPKKIVANKPADIVDHCLDPDGNIVTDLAQCHRLYPYHGDARTVAANHNLRADAIVKAQLKPLDRTDYPGIRFTEQQWKKLHDIFPHGVCDWSTDSISETWSTPWLDYTDRPGGTPMPPSPITIRF